MSIKKTNQWLVLLIIGFFVSSCTSQPVREYTAESLAAKLLVVVSQSDQLSLYQSARGLNRAKDHEGLGFQLLSSSVTPLLNDDLSLGGYNFLVTFIYGWEDNLCTLLFPVKVRETTILELGDGFSDGGCGE